MRCAPHRPPRALKAVWVEGWKWRTGVNACIGRLRLKSRIYSKRITLQCDASSKYLHSYLQYTCLGFLDSERPHGDCKSRSNSKHCPQCLLITSYRNFAERSRNFVGQG